MIIAVLCLVIGLGCMTISGYYSFIWFIDRGMPELISYIFAFVYVTCASISFEYAVEAFKESGLWRKKAIGISKKSNNFVIVKRNKNRTLNRGIIIIIGWAILAGYSMYCTIGGQYDQLMDIEQTVPSEIKVTRDYSNIITLKEESLESDKLERDQIINRLNSVDSVEESWKYSTSTESSEIRLDEVKLGINTLTNELESLYLLQSDYEYIESFSVTSRGFFVYISGLTKGKWDPVVIQFYSALFPSVVADLVGPIFFTIFVVAWKKKESI